eukprot:11078565-Alexandrium_andersonii.AAC.1
MALLPPSRSRPAPRRQQEAPRPRAPGLQGLRGRQATCISAPPRLGGAGSAAAQQTALGKESF